MTCKRKIEDKAKMSLSEQIDIYQINTGRSFCYPIYTFIYIFIF